MKQRAMNILFENFSAHETHPYLVQNFVDVVYFQHLLHLVKALPRPPVGHMNMSMLLPSQMDKY